MVITHPVPKSHIPFCCVTELSILHEGIDSENPKRKRRRRKTYRSRDCPGKSGEEETLCSKGPGLFSELDGLRWLQQHNL
jgi:hypothetical protein